METRDWLEEVTGQLRSSGTSPAYQRRLLDELRDHIEDLSSEERNHAMSAQTIGNEVLDNRLGTPEDIASAAKVNAARGKFAQRHPLVTYLLLPIPTLILFWVAYTLALIGIVQLFESYKDTTWAVSLAGVLVHGLAYVPAIALVVLIAWVALRSETKTTWWLASSILVAFLSGLVMVSFTVPTTPGTGTLQVGMGFPPSLANLPQFIVPLGITLALVGYSLFKKRSAQCSGAV